MSPRTAARFLVLPPTRREVGNGIAALLVTPFARDRELSADERAAVAEARARIVLPVIVPFWIDRGAGGAITPAELEKLAALQLRLQRSLVVRIYAP